LSFVILAMVAGSVVYSVLVMIAAVSYKSVRPPVLVNAEPISILKPLSGVELGLEPNLRTFFEQDYPAFEILFAVRSAEDGAATIVRKLQLEYPSVPSRLLITGEPTYANAKVFSLQQMMDAATRDLLVMSDSDIRVTTDMLRTVAAEFQKPGLGIATCPYRAIPGASVWSRLEATGMNTDFWGSALVARMVEGMKFAVGPTIAARKSALTAIGGFERLKDYLAEDFVMGKLAAAAGYGVILSSYVLEHHIGSSSLQENVAHRLRWARSTRRSRPAGYVGQIFTMSLPWTAALVAVRPDWWELAAVSVIARFVSAYCVSGHVLRTKLNWLLLPVEDLVAFIFWAAGFFGNTIAWRGRRYCLQRDGRFELIEADAGSVPEH
jgi:ceramide glucosyltransferase